MRMAPVCPIETSIPPAVLIPCDGGGKAECLGLSLHFFKDRDHTSQKGECVGKGAGSDRGSELLSNILRE